MLTSTYSVFCVYFVCVQYPKVPQALKLKRIIFVYLLQKYHIKCLNWCTKQRVIQSNIMTVFIRIILTTKKQIIAYCQIQPNFLLLYLFNIIFVCATVPSLLWCQQRENPSLSMWCFTCNCRFFLLGRKSYYKTMACNALLVRF